MNVNNAVKEYNSKLVIIGVLFLGYTRFSARIGNGMGKILEILNGMTILNNSDTFKKLFLGFEKEAK